MLIITFVLSLANSALWCLVFGSLLRSRYLSKKMVKITLKGK